MSFDNENKIIKQNNPIDYIEEYFSRFFDDILRDSEYQLTINSKGLWNTYNISISWCENKKIFEINTYLDCVSKFKSNNSIYVLISNINEKVKLGHFNYSSKLSKVFYNYKVSVKGQDFVTIEQVEYLINITTEECDRFFPVFFVYFNKKKSPQSSIDIAILETCGEA